MKKTIKIFWVFVISLVISGCNSETNLLNKTQAMSDAIINFYHDIDYDISKLPDESKKLLEELKEEELSDKKSINISKNNLNGGESYTEEDNSKGVYFENGDYYVYYKDLNFNNRDEDKRYYAIVNVDHKVAVIYKDEWPILYRTTKNDVNYKYRYMDRVKTEDSITYYYRSYGNASGLMITYYIEDNKIKDISLDYERYYSHEIEEIEFEHTNNYGNIIFIVVGVLSISVIIYFAVKKMKNANRI